MTNQFGQYLETAPWSSNDDDGEPLDNNYGFEDISSDSLTVQETQLENFIERAVTKYPKLLDRYDVTDLAHDFWLTRNGHGAGFWDGDYDDYGNGLTTLAKSFGSCDIVVGDDGKLHFEGGNNG